MLGPARLARWVDHRAVLSLALPAMAMNVATALFGMADTFVVGRLNDPAAQAAVELGAKLMMTVLVVFNFLRSSTVALTAAAGQGREEAQAEVLARALLVAAILGVGLLAAGPVLVSAGLSIFGASQPVVDLARRYVTARYPQGIVWLMNAVMIGWLMGRRRVRGVMGVEVLANLLHVALDLGFVLGLGLGVAGVGLATLCSELAKGAVLVLMLTREASPRRLLRVLTSITTYRRTELADLFRLNRDLFLRTLLLMIATILMTRAGARLGAVVLAANAVIFQLFMLSALILDGFESAAQVLCGEARGQGDSALFRRRMRVIFQWAALAAVFVTALFALGGRAVEFSFSTSPAVRSALGRYGAWAIVLPLTGVAAYVFDGVFIGARWTRPLLISMAWALAGFMGLLACANGLGNDGLWASFAGFLALRAASQALMTPRLVQSSFARAPQDV